MTQTKNDAEDIPEEIKTLFLKNTDEKVDNCSRQLLSENNSVYRLESSGMKRSWILKKTVSTAKEVAAMQIFEICGIKVPRFGRLSENWILMEDLDMNSCEQYIEKNCDNIREGIYRQLGRVTLHADLLGMRDRNLRNMLIDDASKQLILIDFDSAFSIRLFDRYLRPRKYLRYLVMRMFFDVINKVGGYVVEDLQDIFTVFKEGAVKELERLNKVVSGRAKELKMYPIRFHLTVKSRYSAACRLQRDLDYCYQKLINKGYLK